MSEAVCPRCGRMRNVDGTHECVGSTRRDTFSAHEWGEATGPLPRNPFWMAPAGIDHVNRHPMCRPYRVVEEIADGIAGAIEGQTGPVLW